MDAVYPGPTGHALIANDLLAFINQTYSQSFPLINVSTVAAQDQTVSSLKPKGVIHTPASLRLSGDEGVQ